MTMAYLWLYIGCIMLWAVNKLTASDVCFEDDGIYTCTADPGSVGMPPRPAFCSLQKFQFNLTEVESTCTTITVYWTEPSAEIDFYYVMCPSIEGTGNTPIELAAPRTNYTCGNLSCGTFYSVSVGVIIGPRMCPSESIEEQTRDSSVQNLTVTDETCSSISVNWSRPSCECGDIDFYNVTCESNDQSSNYKVNSTENNYTCRNLTCGTDYNITVETVIGNQSNSSTTITAQTQNSTVQYLEVTEVNCTSFLVNWTRPSCEYEIDFYYVTCESNDQSSKYKVNSTETNYTCINVTCETDYKVTVETVIGSNRCSSTVSARTGCCNISTSLPTTTTNVMPTMYSSTTATTVMPTTYFSTAATTVMPTTSPSTTETTDMSTTSPSTTATTDMSTSPSTTATTDMPTTSPSSTETTDMSTTSPSTTATTDIPTTSPSTTETTDMSTTYPSTTATSDMPTTSPSNTATSDMPTTSPSTTETTVMPTTSHSTTATTDMSTTSPSMTATSDMSTTSPSTTVTSDTSTTSPSTTATTDMPTTSPSTTETTVMPTTSPSIATTTVVTCIVPAADPMLVNTVGLPCGSNSSVNYGVQCNFSCPPDCNLNGPSSVNCTRFGNFTDEFPYCDCPNRTGRRTLYFDISQMVTARRKRADVPVDTPAVQDLLSSVVFAVRSNPVVANANGTVLSANDNTAGFISAIILVDVTLLNDIPVQALIDTLSDSINNISGVTVQGSGQLTDVCSAANPCLNGGTCRVDSSTSAVSCTCPNGYNGNLCENMIGDNDIIDTTTILAIVVPLVAVLIIFLLVAMTFVGLIYRRMRWMRYLEWQGRTKNGRPYGMAGTYRAASARDGLIDRRRPSRHRLSEPFVHEDTSDGKRQRSRSIEPRHSGYIASTFVHELDDLGERGRRKNGSTSYANGGMFFHETDQEGPFYRHTMDANGFSYGYPTSSGYNTKESYTNGAVSRQTGLANSYSRDMDTYF